MNSSVTSWAVSVSWSACSNGRRVAGLLIGLYLPWLGQAAAGGLALMMVVALVVRLRIKDTPLQMLPAAGYLLLNAYLCIAGF